MIRERERAAMSGVVILVVLVAVLLTSVFGFVTGIRAHSALQAILSAAAFVTALLLTKGTFSVNPNEARVLQLFGDYIGTVRTPGLRWANPSTRRGASRCASATSRRRASR